MATFILLHGGAHQGQHWDLVRPHLEKRGHQVIAPTLPMDDIDKGATEWADLVIDIMTDVNSHDDLYLVGHSYAGLVLPVIASRIPIKRMIFVCAHVPVPGIPYTTYMEQHPRCSTGPFDIYEYDDQGRLALSYDVARSYFFPKCEEHIAKWAFNLLLPCSMHVLAEPCPITKWPDVDSTYIYGESDDLIGPDWGQAMSLERLGGAAIGIPGDHEPLVGQPQKLAETLDDIVASDSSAVDAVAAR